MSTSAPDAASRELELVGKVELRFALADTDKKLETLLGTYLTPLLLKLESPSDRVKEKVVKVIQHLRVRIQPKYGNSLVS
jgi:proteasome component ECM29